MEKKKTVFDELFHLDVNDRVEKKKTGNSQLSYLSWSWAWAEVKKRFEDAEYVIHKFNNQLPYVYDENTGYMVFTSVTINGITHEMWLPVMDGANKAMKSRPYTYKTRNGDKSVEAATMFDVNKTIMRCLVKNLAMFGLGLYIYSGEDLPEEEPAKAANEKQKVGVSNLLTRLAELTERPFNDIEKSAFEYLKIGNKTTENINVDDYGKLMGYLQPTVAKFEMKEKEKAQAKAEADQAKIEQEGLELTYTEAGQ